MNRGSIPIVLVMLLLVAGGLWFYFNFERVTEREEVGFQGEARGNPLFAALRLFERMGVAAHAARQSAELDVLPAGATVMLSRHRTGISAQRVNALLEWVDAGGHLIVEAANYKDKDPLLDRLNVQRNEIRMRARRPPSDVVLPHASQTLRVHFGYWQKLQPLEPAAYRFDDISGTHLVHQRRGNGMVTVLADMRFMTNPEIAKNDHAEFAWQLIRFMPGTREVVIVPRLETPTLVDWLLDRAKAALAIAAALLAAWLWRLMPRFGPLRPDPQPARRRLLDHLRASGRFHWARGGAERLLAAAREACLRNIARSHPLLVDLPRAERVEKFAALTQINAGQIELALHGDAGDALQFTSAVGVLQRIEDRLVRKIES